MSNHFCCLESIIHHDSQIEEDVVQGIKEDPYRAGFENSAKSEPEWPSPFRCWATSHKNFHFHTTRAKLRVGSAISTESAMDSA